MCGRYYTEVDREEMQNIVNAVNRALVGRQEISEMRTGEIFPSNIVPVYVNGNTGPSVTLMKWGFKGFSGSQLIINAKSETVLDKPMFKESAMTRRCLIPASGYYEWEKRGKEKIKYALKMPSEPLLYMAAIYRVEKDTALPVFTILTREAATDIQFIHDRMPVIFDRDCRKAWMRGEADVKGLVQEATSAVVYEPVA